MILELRQKLEHVARRVRGLRLWTSLALCWLVWAFIGIGMFALAGRVGNMRPLAWSELAALAIASAMICIFLALRSARDQRVVARRIEAQHPELSTLLLAAIEQTGTPRERFSFLQLSVIRDAVEHGRRHNWLNAVGPWHLRLAKAGHFLALGLFIAVCIGLATRAGANSGFTASLFGGERIAAQDFEIAIDPGDCEVERGSALVIVAEFKKTLPPSATLVVDGNADGAQSHEMSRSLDDPKFVGRLAAVNEELTYHVEFAGRRSDSYRVTVFDYPALERADTRLEFPSYTALETKVIKDVRHISAVEGTKLTLDCRLNKPVATAQLVDARGEKIALAADPNNPELYRAAWTLTESRRFKLALVDREGRKNRMPEEIVVNVTPNRPPKIAIERPAKDVEVSPLEELQLKWKVTDDFGVARSGLSYALGGNEPREVELGTGGWGLGAGDSESEVATVVPSPQSPAPSPSRKEQTLTHLIDFESLRAEPDQLVSYFVWAEDIGPDGQPRRTLSDMYFAEVRPFEQIFRQGEQPSDGQQQQQQQQQQQGQSGNQQQAEELAELQKQIINATWKLIRRESGERPTKELPSDSRLVKDSQQSALERSNELAQELEDSQSQGHLKSAQSHMSEAVKQITSAAEGPAAAPLRPALAAEQAAYQDLLKLRAREFQVVRGQQQQQQQGAQNSARNSRMQRQLNELELRADENRYETQSRARAPEENQAQQQSRDVLNRLRDLARRQDDLNERLRELQSALEQAQTAREREELQRELKRLRDQQQEILRDTDEMIGQMDQSANPQQSQEARSRMEQSRSNIEQASKAMEQGQVSQAVTEGARAGRQLNELRDEMRQQSANQFTEEMTEMRRNARELDERQQQISEQLQQQDAATNRSLRGTGAEAEAQAGVQEQQQELHDLLERMKETIDAAEEPEPLLARQLYDAAREAHQQRLEDSLDMARKLLDVGVRREAGQAMRAADKGIGELRRGVEEAAESVLGDETEALRRAQQEVNRLSEEIEREMNQARGEQPGERRNTEQHREGNDSQRSGTSPQDDSNQRAGASSPPADDTNTPREQSSLRGDGNRQRASNNIGELLQRSAAGGGREGGLRFDRRGPITGENFREWSDRLSDVEEMLDDPELRSEAARIRDRAADARREFKRHAKEPDWTKLQDLVSEPLVELSKRIDEAIRRHESPDSLVPIDRDPVPPEFSEQVRRYYERLGSGK